MFYNKRYLTRGVQTTLPADLILLLWEKIDTRRLAGCKLDYLQVFDLSISSNEQGWVLQRIVHRQEAPHYEASFLLDIPDEPVQAKVFVIDDITHSTMLLAEEY